MREGLGEEVEALAEEALPDAVGEAEEDARPAPLRAGERLQAIAASPGIASGPAHVQVAQRFEFQPRGESPAHERDACCGPSGRWTRRSSAWSNAAR